MAKLAKRFAVLFLSVLLLASLSMTVACGKNKGGNNDDYCTVTFKVEGNVYGEAVQVRKNRRVEEPAKPNFSNDSYIFTGWFTSENFEEGTQWNFTTGIVTENITLFAGYREIFDYVSELAMADEATTSKLVWSQKSASAASAYEVKITDAANKETTLEGSVSFDSAAYKVTFTPTTVPQGGLYSVSVRDTTKTHDAATLEEALFCGDGSETNPYLIGTALDFTAVNRANVASGVYYRLFRNITIETSRADQASYTFNGTLIGGGRTITLENSNSAAIYKVGPQGYVFNVNVAGSVTTAIFDSIGSIADFNEGKVEKVNVTANVTSTAGLTGSVGIESALNASLEDGNGSRGIAGGVVGTNAHSGQVINCKIVTSSSSTGTVKARIGGGCIVGLNYGLVENCISDGCLGAWNSVESGKSLSVYSYSGGVVGINAGTVSKCAVTSSGKVLAQRYTDASLVVAGTNNSNLGGVVGYNMQNATVSESSFSGIRVHGDENVGGIVGLNAGAVTDCYAEGVYNDTTKIVAYVGGRINVGGIVGKSEATGTVTNCFNTANVFSYTANTGYNVAEKATNTVYVSANLNAASLADNPAAVALIAPEGTGNVSVEIAAGTELKENYKLAETYLSTINGNNKFVFTEETIKLLAETQRAPELTVTVALYNGSTKWSDAEVAETAAAISGPSKLGFVFEGWSLTENGEILYAATDKVSYYDIIDLFGTTGEAKLYAQFTARVANEGLIVAVWSRYVSEEQATAIKTGFEAYLTEHSIAKFDIEFRAYAENSVADFCAAVLKDGDIDVIIGAGNTVNASNGIDYIRRENMTAADLTDRRVVLLTDTERALLYFSYESGIENADAEVTFVVGQTTGEAQTLNSVLANDAEIPEVVAPADKVFAGWATTENATEAEITAKTINYDTVKDLLNEGKVTLYPVFVSEASSPDMVVAVWVNEGKWISDENLEAIKAGFAAYLAESGDTAEYNIVWRVYTPTGVADLGAAVNADKDVDIIIGCGSNVTSKGGVETIEKENLTFPVAGSSRMAARLTENELAVKLYTYLTAATTA